jgi:hypothetical protein
VTPVGAGVDENTYHLETFKGYRRPIMAAKLATGFELLHHQVNKEVVSNPPGNQSNELPLLNITFEP